eukprot:422779-Pelagomonas_calceolata.AAC.3
MTSQHVLIVTSMCFVGSCAPLLLLTCVAVIHAGQRVLSPPLPLLATNHLIVLCDLMHAPAPTYLCCCCPCWPACASAATAVAAARSPGR